MALRAASWDRQTNTPHPSEAEKRRTERKHCKIKKNIMQKPAIDQNEIGPA